MHQITNRLAQAYYKYEIPLCLLAVLWVSLLVLLKYGYSAVIMFLAIICVSIVVDRFIRICKRMKYDDERTWMLVAYASMNTVFTIALVMTGLEFLLLSHVIGAMSFWDLFGIVDATLVLTFFSWSIYYYVKGFVQ